MIFKNVFFNDKEHSEKLKYCLCFFYLLNVESRTSRIFFFIAQQVLIGVIIFLFNNCSFFFVLPQAFIALSFIFLSPKRTRRSSDVLSFYIVFSFTIERRTIVYVLANRGSSTVLTARQDHPSRNKLNKSK